MRKILIITDRFYKEIGGSYEAIGSTLYNLRNQGIKIKFIYFNNGEREFNINLNNLIKEYEIIHFFGIWTYNHVKTFLVSILNKKKIIVTPMGALEPWSISQKNLKKKIALLTYQKLILRRVNIVHCTSIDEERNIKKIDPNIKTKFIPHSSNLVKNKKKSFKCENKLKFLFFSRIHKKKGLEDVIKAWSEVKLNNCELHIYGPDGDGTKNLLIDLTNKFNLQNQIFFHEPVFKLKEKIKVYDKFDVSILLSRNENFSYSILEALQCSLPVFTNDNTPWSEINSLNAGWYIKNEYDEIKKTLHKISNLTKEELIEKSKNAYGLAQKYSWEKLFAKYKKMYDEV